MAKDFRNKTFGRILRGYNPEEVDEYIAYISDEYRKLERRCADSERKLALALKKLDELNQKFMGDGNADHELAAAAISEAKDEADRIISDANVQAAEITEAAEHEAAQKARLILENAAKEAEGILAGAEEDAREGKKTAAALFETAGKMYGEVCAFRDSLFEIYNSHIESIERMTEEAEGAMSAIEDAYEPAAPVEEDAGDPYEPDESGAAELMEEDAEEAEYAEEAPEDTEEITEFPEAEEIAEEEKSVADMIIDLEEALEEPDPALLEDDAEDPALPGFDPDEAQELPDGLIDAYDEDEFDLPAETAEMTEDFAAADEQDDMFGFDAIDDDDDGFRIDWNSRRAVDESEEEDDGFGDEKAAAPKKEENEPAKESAFMNLDELFMADEKESELSLTEEFNLVFNSTSAKQNVEQIRRQPTVAPEKPKNPKKHQKF